MIFLIRINAHNLVTFEDGERKRVGFFSTRQSVGHSPEEAIADVKARLLEEFKSIIIDSENIEWEVDSLQELEDEIKESQYPGIFRGAVWYDVEPD